MRAISYIQKYFVKKLKDIPRETWVEQGEDAYVPFHHKKIDNVDVKYYQDVKRQPK